MENKIKKALTKVLNDKNIFVLNSKNRAIPFESTLYVGENLRTIKDIKGVPTLLISSDNRQSGKTTICCAYALANAVYYPNSLTYFYTISHNHIRYIREAILKGLIVLNDINDNNVNIKEYKSNEIIFDNDSVIQIKCYDQCVNSINTPNLIIYDDAHHLTKEDLCLDNFNTNASDKLILLAVTNSELNSESFINTLL